MDRETDCTVRQLLDVARAYRAPMKRQVYRSAKGAEACVDQTEASTVLANIAAIGYHLQVPPPAGIADEVD